ncbi:hypothetical protein C4588_06930 [Candidatus Parcubacteria bacterium]|nr:MAG: hypothetical protein C4588_06930 [Candidatus Parcubacteria bacterium]
MVMRKQKIPTLNIETTKALRRFKTRRTDFPKDAVEIHGTRACIDKDIDLFLFSKMNGIPRKWFGWGAPISLNLDNYHTLVPFSFQGITWDPFTKALQPQHLIKALINKQYWIVNDDAITTVAKIKNLSVMSFIENKTHWLREAGFKNISKQFEEIEKMIAKPQLRATF